MYSDAASVADYIESLTESRCEAIKTVREVILAHLPKGYEEVMNWGMITYQVPLEVFPDTYNKKPLMYAALASQKNYMSVYMMGLYVYPKIEKKFLEAYEKSNQKLNMGKCCVRFKSLEALNLNAVAQVIKAVSLKDHLAHYGAREKRSKKV
jgi:uncharacterized protein YdhG (YjbR/CyaY superfamily)